MLRTPDETLSIWHEAVPDVVSQPPDDAAVCVIGAGISGLTTAYLLQRAGLRRPGARRVRRRAPARPAVPRRT